MIKGYTNKQLENNKIKAGLASRIRTAVILLFESWSVDSDHWKVFIVRPSGQN